MLSREPDLASALLAHAARILARVVEAGTFDQVTTALEALERLGVHAATTLPTLVQVLDGSIDPPREADRPWRLRDLAARALGAMGEAAAPAVPAILALASREPTPRSVDALGRIADPTATPTLLEIAREATPETDLDIALAAIDALGAMGCAARPAVPWLVQAHDSRRFPDSPWSIPHALAMIGPPSEDVLRIVLAYADPLLENTESPFRADAANLLYRLALTGDEQPSRLTVRLIELLDDPDHAVVLWAMLGLETASAAESTPALQAVARDHPDALVRDAAERSLERIRRTR